MVCPMTNRYLRDASRSLLRRRGFAAAVVLTLALVIGANTTLFTLVNAVALRPLPYDRPEELYWIWHSSTVGERGAFSMPDVVEYERESRAFAGLAAFRLWSANLTGHGDTERLTGIRVSERFFQLLGVSAAHGRVFTGADDDSRLLVLHHGVWQRRFGGARDVVGRTLLLNGVPYVVVGVLPEGFVFPMPEAEFAVPLAMDLDPNRHNPAVSGLRMVGRLNDGVALGRAEAELEATTARLRSLYPDDNAGKHGINLVSIRDEILGSHRRLLFVLWAAVSAVLVIACTNLASLHLAQAGARRREFAIRLALGAERRHIVRQLLVESALLATVGGLLGILMARAGIDGFLSLAPTEIPRAGDASIDGVVLLFSFGLAVVTGLLVGVWPALEAARSDPQPVLHAESRSVTSATAARARARLVAAQSALAVLLAVGAALFLESFERLLSVETGFQSRGLLTARLALPQSRYGDPASIARFVEALTERTASLPSVRSAAAVSVLPLSGYRSTASFEIEGQAPPPADQAPFAHYRLVGAGYFRTMGIPLVRGREFDANDRADAERVAVINRTMADRFWPGRSAVGSALLVDDGDGLRRLTIVGVVADVRHQGLDQPVQYDLYVALPQMPPIDVLVMSNLYLVLRAGGDPRLLAGAVREAVAAIDRDVAASQLRTMEDVLGVAVAPRRFGLTLLAGFAGAALLLVALGVYALTNQITSQRRRELGIRLAIGARPSDVVRLVTLQTLRPALVGVVAGTLIAIASGRLVRSLLFDVSSTDVWALLGGAASVVVIGWVATLAPTIRASRIPPGEVLADS